jgi:hypothetical protein
MEVRRDHPRLEGNMAGTPVKENHQATALLTVSKILTSSTSRVMPRYLLPRNYNCLCAIPGEKQQPPACPTGERDASSQENDRLDPRAH